MRTRYQDMMDSTRLVEPVKKEGTSFLCRIYWNTDAGVHFGGMAHVPCSLFDEGNRLTERIGFLPAV